MIMELYCMIGTLEIGCKCIGSICILIGISCFAMCMNKSLDERLYQLNILYSLLIQLKNEMKYLYNLLPDCFEHLSQREGPFSEWFHRMAERLTKCEKEDFIKIWDSELEWLSVHSALEEEDVSLLYDLGRKLEESDITIKLQSIDYVLLHLEKNKNEYQKLLVQKKKLCTSMCAFVGALTLIILL